MQWSIHASAQDTSILVPGRGEAVTRTGGQRSVSANMESLVLKKTELNVDRVQTHPPSGWDRLVNTCCSYGMQTEGNKVFMSLHHSGRHQNSEPYDDPPGERDHTG